MPLPESDRRPVRASAVLPSGSRGLQSGVPQASNQPLCRFCKMLAERSRTVEGVNAAGSGVCADFGVKCCLIGSKLAHIAEYSHFSSLRLFQNIERCLHRNRVCVVAVIDNGVFSCLDDVESSAHRLQCLDSLFDLLQRQPVHASDCGSGQRIVNHMASRNRNQCEKLPCGV